MGEESGDKKVMVLGESVGVLQDCNWCNRYTRLKPGAIWSTSATFHGVPAGIICGRPGRQDVVRDCARKMIGTHAGECYWMEQDPLGGDAVVITGVSMDGTTRLVGVMDTACQACETCPEDEPASPQPDGSPDSSSYVDTNEHVIKLLTGDDCNLCRLFESKPGYTPGGGIGLSLGYVYHGDCSVTESEAALVTAGPEYGCVWIEEWRNMRVAYGFNSETLMVDLLGVGTGEINGCGLCGCDRVVQEWKTRMEGHHATILEIDDAVVGFRHQTFRHWDSDARKWITYVSEFADPGRGAEYDETGLGCWNLRACIEVACVPNVYPDPDPDNPGFDPEVHKWDAGWWYSGITCDCREVAWDIPEGTVDPEAWAVMVPMISDFITFIPTSCDCPDLRDIVDGNKTVFGVTSTSPSKLGDNYVYAEVNIDGSTRLYRDVRMPAGNSVQTSVPMFTPCQGSQDTIDWRTRIVQTTKRLDDTQSGEPQYVYPILAITPCPELNGGKYSPGITNISENDTLSRDGGKYGPVEFIEWEPWKAYVDSVEYIGPYNSKDAADAEGRCAYSEAGVAPYVQYNGDWYKLVASCVAHQYHGWHSEMNWDRMEMICHHLLPGNNDDPGLGLGCPSNYFADVVCEPTTCESMSWIYTSGGMLLNGGIYTEHVEWDCGGRPCWADPDTPEDLVHYEWDWHPFPGDMPYCGVSGEDSPAYSIGECECKDPYGCPKEAYDLFCEHGPGWYCRRVHGMDMAEAYSCWEGCDKGHTPQCPEGFDPCQTLYISETVSHELFYAANRSNLCSAFSRPQTDCEYTYAEDELPCDEDEGAGSGIWKTWRIKNYPYHYEISFAGSYDDYPSKEAALAAGLCRGECNCTRVYVDGAWGPWECYDPSDNPCEPDGGDTMDIPGTTPEEDDIQ